jgi:DNA-binding response OmpR family regulator
MSGRILCVSYDSLTLDVEMLLLHGHGYRTYSSPSNEQAKLLLANESFDIVVLGCAAPIHTRNEIAAWIKQYYPTPIVALTNESGDQIESAEYNVRFTEPGKWLDCIRTLAFGNLGSAA